MAWYERAQRMELQPESDAQPAIDPTQFILHSIAAPWSPRRIYEFWRDSTSDDCHFGLGFDGALAQYIGTETRADASAAANRRPDGTGAVSMETASNLEHTDPWTAAQIRVIIEVGVWLHHRHGIPLRICRSASDPGYGYHSLHRSWSRSGTACPGEARIAQFYDVVFPGIVRAVQGGPAPAPAPQPLVPEEDTMAIYGPVLLPRGVVGDASAVSIPLTHGPASVEVIANYVPPGEKIHIRLDELNANGSIRQQNKVFEYVNGQWGFLPVVGPGTIAVQRLDHPDAHVSVTVVTGA